MLKDYLKDKAVGFWFSTALVLLSAVTAVVYAACYAGTDDIDWMAFAFLLAAVVAAVLLIVFKRFEYVPYVQAALIFVSLLFFIYGIYYYVSVVAVGIDLDTFEPEFIACATLFLLTFGLGVANVFLKQTKEEVKTDE